MPRRKRLMLPTPTVFPALLRSKRIQVAPQGSPPPRHSPAVHPIMEISNEVHDSKRTYLITRPIESTRRATRPPLLMQYIPIPFFGTYSLVHATRSRIWETLDAHLSPFT